MAGKTYNAQKEKVPTQALDTAVAIAWLKEHGRSSFAETVELHIHLGINIEKSEQFVRGTVTLPGGAAKQKRVAVFTSDEKQQAAATKAGATIVGGEELVKQVLAEGKLAADITVATPDMMPKIAPAARVLGPQGLMPNPKTGTVSDDPAGVVAELAAGKLSFKMDQLGNLHEAVGKTDWDADKIEANVRAVVDAVAKARPAAAKGEFIKSITLATTMGPGVRVSV
ncbi:50S ribosomal protein L1 [bacterium]|nr:50S ribosomal protein L1 [bacterium]